MATALPRTDADQALATAQEPGMGVKFLFRDDAARKEFEDLVERMMQESLGPAATKALLHK